MVKVFEWLLKNKGINARCVQLCVYLAISVSIFLIQYVKITIITITYKSVSFT